MLAAYLLQHHKSALFNTIIRAGPILFKLAVMPRTRDHEGFPLLLPPPSSVRLFERPVDDLVSVHFELEANGRQFDDLQFAGGYAVPLAGAGTDQFAPFTYQGLNYTNFFQGTASQTGGNVGSADGVYPQSTPNVIGSPSYRPDQVDPSDYTFKEISPASDSQTFDLTSFYYGCTLFGSTSGSGCAIAVTGHHPDGSLIPASSFNFFRGPAVGTFMFKAQLPESFRGISQALIGTAVGEDGTGPTVVVLDDIEYTLN
ncbi:MAG: hypothetical protein Q9159_000108 [Coniocarpon cinnabarinum]